MQLDPLGLKVHSIDVDGHPVAYLDQGEGPPVLLLHGAPLTSLGFVRVVRRLGRHHRVVAPDLPGFGGTPTWPGFGGRLADYADFVERFTRAVGIGRHVLFVNDASGSFGLAAATRTDVAGVVVADTAPLPMTGLAWFVRMFLAYGIGSAPVRWLSRRFNLIPWMVVTVAPLLARFSTAERRVLLDAFETPAQRERPLDLMTQMGRDTEFMHTTADAVRAHLADTPALLLYGAFDPMRLIGAVRSYRRLLPRHTVHIVPKEEHFPILASGAAVADAVHTWMETEVNRREAA